MLLENEVRFAALSGDRTVRLLSDMLAFVKLEPLLWKAYLDGLNNAAKGWVTMSTAMTQSTRIQCSFYTSSRYRPSFPLPLSALEFLPTRHHRSRSVRQWRSLQQVSETLLKAGAHIPPCWSRLVSRCRWSHLGDSICGCLIYADQPRCVFKFT